MAPDAASRPHAEAGPADRMPLGPLDILAEFPQVSVDEWRALVEKDLHGAPFEKRLVTHTYEGISIAPLYTEADRPGGADGSGFPGLAPFTRGSHALGGALCGWDIRQERTEPDPKSFNDALLDDLEHGVTSVQVRFDAAARSGLDPDDDEADGLVGRDGAGLFTVDDLDVAFESVHLDMIGVGLEAGAAFLPAAAAMSALWRQRGADPAKVTGAFNADPLAVLARDGRLPVPLEHALGQAADLAVWTAREHPRVTAIRVGTAPYHHAGATAAQDLAFSMATAVQYLRAMTDAGLELRCAAKQLLFSYAVGCNFFLAASKLRAARTLWTAVLESCGVDPAAAPMRMHVRTSKRVITARDPWVNMLRNTACAFAGAIGGAEIITTTPFDAAAGLPSPLARRIARNTQIILQDESGLARVADPSGGSYFAEHLSHELAAKAWEIFQEIERLGGMGACLLSGWVSARLAEAVAPRDRNIATRRDAVTGVSEFPNIDERPIEAAPIDYDTVRDGAIDRAHTRGEVSEAADAATEAISGDASDHPAGERTALALAAVSGGETIGAVCRALWNGQEPEMMAPIAPHAYAEPFELLRDAADDYAERCGHRPRVFLACLGPLAVHTARATYAKNFFNAGGFEVDASDPLETAEDVTRAFKASEHASIAVICSSDDVYQSGLAAETAAALRTAGAHSVVLAGHPGAHEDAYREAGVDRFIFIKCDVLETLRDLLTEEGVLS